MIDTKELRRLAQAATPGPWKMLPVGDGRQKFAVADSEFLSILTVTDEGGATFGTVYDDDDARFIAAANPAAISELLDRLEAAESETASWKGLATQFGQEADALRAKIEQIERQEPVGWLLDGDFYEVRQMSLYKDNEPLPGQTALYALPGAQPAPSVPNLDMDALERKNDALKEEVGRLRDALALIADQYEPKCNLLIPSIARSALCATGAYGQTEAQPAQSVPDGWKLVPIEPTHDMREAGVFAGSTYYDVAEATYEAMLAAAPEAKP